MKRTLVAVLGGWLVWGAAIRAEDPPTAPVTTPQQLYDGAWMPPPAHVAEVDGNCANLHDHDPFSAWQGTFQAMAGYYLKTSLGPQGPPFDYVPMAVRVGGMLNTPMLDGCCLRGCVEVLLEGNYCSVLRDFGSYVTGPCLIARYNFVQPEYAFIPYLQGGAGLAFTDAWDTPLYYQGLIGQQLEFLLRAEVGVRLMITDCLSLDAEAGFQHISNASLAKNNAGVNNLGFALGFTYFFGRWK